MKVGKLPLIPYYRPGDARLGAILSSQSHFIPQLALSKRFDTRIADAMVGSPAQVVATYWKQMIAHLMVNNWRCVTEAAA